MNRLKSGVFIYANNNCLENMMVEEISFTTTTKKIN